MLTARRRAASKKFKHLTQQSTEDLDDEDDDLEDDIDDNENTGELELPRRGTATESFSAPSG